MVSNRVPAAVRKTLGNEAPFGMIELLDSEEKQEGERVLATATDRFEVRLTQDTGLPRRELHTAFEALRTDINATKVEILR